jgi:hypothetical protein
MRAPETDVQIKSTKQELDEEGKPKRDEKGNRVSTEAETYIRRNYGAIHSIVKINETKSVVKSHKPVDNHFVPVQAGVEVLSWSKRIMNEVMCLAEDIGINIYITDTDSMHLPEADVPRLEKAFFEKYGRELNGKQLGQFHPDFEFHKDKEENEKYKDVHSVELIALGKKAYLDRLEATHKETGEVKQSLHIRMKGVPSSCIEHLAAPNNKQWDNPERIQKVRDLYFQLLHGEKLEFDLTMGGIKACFESCRNFTVRSRDKFPRKIKFLKPDIQHFA